MPSLPDGQLGAESHRYPFWPLASWTGSYHRRVPLDRVWYHVWAPGRLERCWKIYRAEGTDPSPASLMRICDDYYIDSNGNHRMAFWDQREDVKSVVARLCTVRYEKDVLSKAILKAGDPCEMWVYKCVDYVPTHDGRWVPGVHWYREFIRQDVYDWLCPIWSNVTNVKNDWRIFLKRDVDAFERTVMVDKHVFSPYHSTTLATDSLLEANE